MNSFKVHIVPNREASLTACFFLLLIFLPGAIKAQQWQFDTNSLKAYDLALNLKTSEALQIISNSKTVQSLYVASIAEALELMVIEDGEKFTSYERHFQNRLDRITSTSAEALFVQAEMHLHWTFVYLKFGHELDAALNLKQAYSIVQDCKKDYPDFVAIKKTSGLLNVIIGAIPQKYDWVLSLFGMQGSISLGLAEMESVEVADSHLAFEAELLHALVKGFVLQETAMGLAEMNKAKELYPNNRLTLFLGATLAIKNSQSEEALALLTKLNNLNNGIPIYYAHYLMGEVSLHRADYHNAIKSYEWFLKHYKGQNYIKDAHYKIGLCYLLNGNAKGASTAFKEARNMGKETTEADRYAARSLAEDEFPHIKLTKARYYSDGGYYSEAQKILSAITPDELPTKRDHVEFFYRKARLEHKMNKLAAAKLFYKQTIDINGDEPWYFAPNACLQMGYIALEEKDINEAKRYFEKALSYSKHEYKNSIDSKAKSALGQIKSRK